MAINFNTEPYYDNFDETKKFYRILYKPGYAVQARELTQMQTVLQDQIKKFGQHIFKEGTIVLGGQRSFDSDIVSIKLDNSYAGTNISISSFNGVEIVGQTSGTKGYSKIAVAADSTNPHTLLVKITSGTDFTPGEVVTCVVNSITYNATIQAATATTSPFSTAMLFSINSGVFFVNSHFVYLEPQIIAVDAYSNTSSKNIGFVVNERAVSYEEDESLLDNAQGTFNYAAPGADRYEIDLVLTAKNLDATLNNFFEVARIVDGQLVVNLDKTVYSEIGKELARRTFDESGDYTVKNWPIQILDDIDGDSTKFTVALDPGKAYVKGYEFETINQEYLSLDRARDFATTSGINTNVNYGNFINVTNMFGAFLTNAATNAYTSVELHNVVRTSVTSASTKIGTARVRFIQLSSGSPGTSAVYKMYLFNIAMSTGQNFKNVESIIYADGAGTYVDSGANIHTSSKIGAVDSGDAFLSGTDAPGLVFPLSNQFIKDVYTTEYRTQKTITPLSFSSGQAYSTLGENEQWVGGPGLVSSTNKNTHYHVVFTSVTTPGSTGYTAGSIADFSSGARTITISGTPNANHLATFNLQDAAFSGTAVLVATVDLSNQASNTRSKQLSSYTKVIIGTGSTGGLNTVSGNRDSLGISDIYDVAGIYNIGTNNGSAVTVNPTTGAITWGSVANTNVTSRYVVDNGQRAELYDHGSLILNGAPPTATHYLLVVLRNFIHTGTGFLTKNSYIGTNYSDIPSFTDPATGINYNLRDCIDFRPVRSTGSTVLTNAQLQDPDSTLEVNYDYYLGRMDKIIAMPDKTFNIKKGIPALYPTVPSDDTNGMTIYAIIIPPYTSSVGDIGVKYVDNKRYTMRDIGRLDKRIQNLEYYTQLSLLEKQAKDTSIPDASNFEKFKNGFVVDPFTSQDIFAAAATTWSERRWSWWTNWFNGSNSWNTFGALNYNANSISEPANIDFNAAIDPLNQELRAPFTIDFLAFDDPALVNTSRRGPLVTLGYTEVSAISQMLATKAENINPFNVIKFIGKVNLEPSFDQWVDTTVLPAVNNIVDVLIPDAPDVTIDRRTGSGNRVRNAGSTSVTNTNEFSSDIESLGSSVVDIQFVPFIRETTIVAIASGLKPKARVYPFMDNANVSANCKPLTLLTVTGGDVGEFLAAPGDYEPLTFTSGATGVCAYYSAPSLTDPTKRTIAVADVNGSIAIGNTVTGARGGTAVITAITNYNLGDALAPDEFGFLALEFQLPPSTFRTGERTFRLIDNTLNDASETHSIGEAKYTATGLVQSTQENILTTRVLQNQRVTTLTGQWFRSDPLAQSIFVDPLTFPQGLHVSSIDVFFKTKSTSVPVVMQLRRVVNGYPESDPTIPFAEVTLLPEQVSVSSNSSAATTFTFPSPIHVTPGDYAIVLLANTQDYEVFIAETGKPAIGSTAIVDKQPYIGSLFKSQNAATWTAVQEQDLMFVLRRAEFVSSGTAVFDIQDPASVINYHTLFVNTSAITPNNTSITWEASVFADGATAPSDFTPINIRQDIDYSALKSIQAQAANGFATLRLRATLTTSNPAVSPAIDSEILSVVVVENQINNDSTGEAGFKQGGNAVARYITKSINLADGFEASNLCVTLDANKPPGTDIKVYYKALPTEKVTPIVDELWVEMVPETAIPNSANALDYRENRFFPAGAFDVYGVPSNAPIAQRFNTFQIKIVLLSTSTVSTPKLRDLRIIALDS